MKEKIAKEIEDQIHELNRKQAAGILDCSYKTYLSRFKALQRKWKKAKYGPTQTDQMKSFGSKVTRICKGAYIYHGVNFRVRFDEDACETVYWSIDGFTDPVDGSEQPYHIYEWSCECGEFETKKELLQMLFCYDQEMSQKKEVK